MAKVTYIGTADETDSFDCTVFGLSFVKGEAVELADVPAKLRTNPTFDVADDPLDHDGDGRKGGSKPRAAKSEA